MTVFDDPLYVDFYDPDHSAEEHRYVIVGTSRTGRLLIVSYTERREAARLISAREVTPAERSAYEEGWIREQRRTSSRIRSAESAREETWPRTEKLWGHSSTWPRRGNGVSGCRRCQRGATFPHQSRQRESQTSL